MKKDPSSASFVVFDRKASTGEPLSVVFFGGSLTWGANASDPQKTSWRGLMMDYLRKKYPRASFAFHDAAIGGTNSKLGMFRFDRDVLAKKPDLVFYDFTVNDGIEASDLESLASYESLLRKMITMGIPVVQVMLLFRNHRAPGALKLPRYIAHQKLAGAYHTGTADALAYVTGLELSGKAVPEVLWPADGSHPYDEGYRLFFEAVRDGFEKTIGECRVCALPDTTVFPAKYADVSRIVLVDRPLPKGWRRHTAYRTSLWFDGLPSRWMGDMAVCGGKDAADVEPLEIEFSGTLIGLFGEKAGNGLAFKAQVDGQPLSWKNNKGESHEIWPNDLAVVAGGWNGAHLFSWIELSCKLEPGRHTLKIEPVFDPANPDGELHIESVCSAG